jgi:hypothetical protein
MDADVIEKLLAKTHLSEQQVVSRLQSALEPAYWRQLNPELSISSGCVPGAVEELPIDDAQLNRIRDQFAEGGYFQTGPALATATIARLRECIERLQAKEWPPVFAFVYDEFWMVPRLPSIGRLLSTLLGSDYRQMHWAWVHYVHPQRGAAGWAPSH